MVYSYHCYTELIYEFFIIQKNLYINNIYEQVLIVQRPLAVIGPDSNDISTDASGVPVHRRILPDWIRLQTAAAEAGFELALASGYRDPERQRLIWNRKAAGERAVLDSNGEPLDLTRLAPWQQVQAILRWSALPGASRHHWGCDLDVFDRRAVAADYAVQLSREEVEQGGPFAPMHDWLDEYLAKYPENGFFRPYAFDRGGIAPERWHLSYAPIAAPMQCRLQLADLQSYWQSADILLRDTIMAYSEEIFRRFVWVPAEVYPEPYRTLIAASTPDYCQ